jgi:hypothetical protein
VDSSYPIDVDIKWTVAHTSVDLGDIALPNVLIVYPESNVG